MHGLYWVSNFGQKSNSWGEGRGRGGANTLSKLEPPNWTRRICFPSSHLSLPIGFSFLDIPLKDRQKAKYGFEHFPNSFLCSGSAQIGFHFWTCIFFCSGPALPILSFATNLSTITRQFPAFWNATKRPKLNLLRIYFHCYITLLALLITILVSCVSRLCLQRIQVWSGGWNPCLLLLRSFQALPQQGWDRVINKAETESDTCNRKSCLLPLHLPYHHPHMLKERKGKTS